MSPGRLPATDLSVRSLPVGSSALQGAGLRAHPYRRASPIPSGLATAASTSHLHRDVAVHQSPTATMGPLHGSSAIATHAAGDVGIGDVSVTSHRVSANGATPPNLSPWSSQQSLQDGDHFDTRFTSYTPPHGGISMTNTAQLPVANASPVPHAGVSIEDVEFMMRAMSLDAERSTVLQYNEMAANDRLTVLFLHVLRLSHDLKAVTLRTTEAERRLGSVEELVQRAWQPSKAQNALIRSLVRHFLVKPLSSYNALPDYVKTYVADHARDLRLGLYLKDKTVKTTLNIHIGDVSIQMKSAFRKGVFASIKKKVPLHSFARNMLDNYHLPAIPAEIPLAILGTFALMREIAEPLTKKANSAKGDTGFWRAVHEELNNLYDDFDSADRYNDPKWIQWASNKVREDGVRFPAAGGRFAAATREELDRALGSAANPENGDVDILGNGDANGPMTVDEEPDMDDEEMDGDIEVSAMGDVAATVRMDTA